MLPLVPLLIGLPWIGFWLWMLVDLANNDYLFSREKTCWFIVIMLFNVAGSVWYYTVEYRPRYLQPPTNKLILQGRDPGGLTVIQASFC